MWVVVWGGDGVRVGVGGERAICVEARLQFFLVLLRRCHLLLQQPRLLVVLGRFSGRARRHVLRLQAGMLGLASCKLRAEGLLDAESLLHAARVVVWGR